MSAVNFVGGLNILPGYAFSRSGSGPGYIITVGNPDTSIRPLRCPSPVCVLHPVDGVNNRLVAGWVSTTNLKKKGE
ncbi:hypothetical protein P9617_gp01 [Escherichia phage SECphi18]|uniref:hypothetical protein n=1 Tax=Escherichia phage SECphi18 TaxID=2045373 RepID=UPI00248F5787|nr:hypothetical protein P9617_gp01 [Escherichia phage SECphi18]